MIFLRLHIIICIKIISATPVLAVVVVGFCWISARTLGQGESSPGDGGPDEPHHVGHHQVLLRVHAREEVEVHQRPQTSPEVEWREECGEWHQVYHEGLARTASPKIVLDIGVDAEDEEGENKCNGDTVPSLEILDDNLTRFHDIVVLQLPESPPAADDETVNDGVAEDGVKDVTVVSSSVNGVTEVAVGSEDIVNAVSDDGYRSASGTFEGFDAEQGERRRQEHREKLVPLHVWECWIENIEPSDPENNAEESIKIDDDNFGHNL